LYFFAWRLLTEGWLIRQDFAGRGPTFFAKEDKESFHIHDPEFAELFLSRVLENCFK
jgi:hypothetical protein